MSALIGFSGFVNNVSNEASPKFKSEFHSILPPGDTPLSGVAQPSGSKLPLLPCSPADTATATGTPCVTVISELYDPPLILIFAIANGALFSVCA